MTRDEIWKECFVNDFEEPNLKLEIQISLRRRCSSIFMAEPLA